MRRFEIERSLAKSTVPASGRAILMVLLSLCDAETATTQRFPVSIGRIVDASGYSKSTVCLQLLELERAGWIRRHKPTMAEARRDHVRTWYEMLDPTELSDKACPTVGLGDPEACPMVGQGMSDGRTRGLSDGRTGSAHEVVQEEVTAPALGCADHRAGRWTRCVNCPPDVDDGLGSTAAADRIRIRSAQSVARGQKVRRRRRVA